MPHLIWLIVNVDEIEIQLFAMHDRLMCDAKSVRSVRVRIMESQRLYYDGSSELPQNKKITNREKLRISSVFSTLSGGMFKCSNEEHCTLWGDHTNWLVNMQLRVKHGTKRTHHFWMANASVTLNYGLVAQFRAVSARKSCEMAIEPASFNIFSHFTFPNKLVAAFIASEKCVRDRTGLEPTHNNRFLIFS